MNPELQRQHEAHKARQARLRAPVCRAIVDKDIVRETILPMRREDMMAAAKRQHAVRVSCIKSYYNQQRAIARDMMQAAETLALAELRTITQFETRALRGELELYEMDMREARG